MRVLNFYFSEGPNVRGGGVGGGPIIKEGPTLQGTFGGAFTKRLGRLNFEKDANSFGSQGLATNSTHQNLSNQGAAKEFAHYAFQRGGFRA